MHAGPGRASPSKRPGLATVCCVVAALLAGVARAQDGQNGDVATDILRINGGGGELIPPDTRYVWRADETYFRGDTRVLQIPPDINVSATYRTQRSGTGVNGQWLYYVVPNVYDAVFEVTFHFIELEHRANNLRVFNVIINDQLVIADLDIYRRVGINAPLQVGFELPLAGRTVFKFEGGVAGRPICSGLELVRRDVVPTPPPTPTTTMQVITASLLPVVVASDSDDYTMVYLLAVMIFVFLVCMIILLMVVCFYTTIVEEEYIDEGVVKEPSTYREEMMPFDGIILEPPAEEGQIIEVVLDEVGSGAVIPDGQSFSVAGRAAEDRPVYNLGNNVSETPIVNHFDSDYVATNSQVYTSRLVRM